MTDEPTPVAASHGKRAKYEFLMWCLTGGAAVFGAVQGMPLNIQYIVGAVWGTVTIYALVSIIRWRSARKRGQ